MAYEALYTRARPKNLAQLVGQEHISNSLARALNQDRLSHAYLLVGTRGTGKTSTARILAKAINCDTVHNAKENNQPLQNNSIPCNECEACRSFKSSPDNIEFDAASNRSVEDVSRLLSTAYLAPLQSRYKTFIIDEVHMLSFEAVNSILKLIEEPPPNVIFFLATTEFNKVPQTIRSRCQILNFKLIPQDIIANHIINLAKGLNFSLEDLAVKKIARLAKGSMRDALTLFDQCYSMTDSDILTVDIVDNTLGLVSDSDLDEIIEAAKSKDRSKIIKSTNAAFKSGLTANIIAESIITRLRDIVSKINDSRSTDLAIYNEMIDQLRKSVIEMQGSGIPEVILETSLFKFASQHIPVRPKPNDDDIFDDFEEIPTPAPKPKSKTSTHDKVVNLNDYKSIEKNKISSEDDFKKIYEPIESNEFDEEDFQGSDTIEEDFSSEDEDLYISDVEEQENRQNESKAEMIEEEQLKIEDIILNSIIDYFKQRGENEIIDCLSQAKLVNFKSGVISIKFEKINMLYLFGDYVDKIEEAAKILFDHEIKFKIVTGNESTNDLQIQNDIFNKLSEENKKYLFGVMELFEVNKNDVKLLKNNN